MSEVFIIVHVLGFAVCVWAAQKHYFANRAGWATFSLFGAVLNAWCVHSYM